MCNCDVPRNALGWPTVEPKYFTMEQLFCEAQRWVGCATDYDTVGRGEWDKYSGEILNRQFMDEVERRKWVRERRAPKMKKDRNGKWYPEW